MLKLVFFTVMPSPYQRELFRVLSRSAGIGVEVYYFTAVAPDRRWTPARLASYEHLLPGMTLRWLGPSAHANAGLIKAVRHSNADVYVVSDYSAPSAQFVMHYLSWTRRRWAYWGERPGVKPRGVAGSFARRRLQAPLIAGASCIAAIGLKAVEAYHSLTQGRIPIVNIPYFCEIDRFAEARVGQPPSRDAVNVLFSGQLIERKGVDLLIHAFNRLAREAPALRLTLIGHGHDEARLRNLVDPSARERVEFRGHVEPEDLPREFAKADIFVLPSRHDGWGVVLNEALGSGMPLVASDAVGAADELIEQGVNGYVFPSGDADALYERLRLLVMSPSLRERLAAGSRSKAQLWRPERAVSLFHELAEASGVRTEGLRRLDRS